MRAGSVFVDTNVLVYLHDRKDLAKAESASDWMYSLAKAKIAKINLQVLNELAQVLLRRPWFDNVDQVFAVIDAFKEIGDTPVSWREVHLARSLHNRTLYSWWDCILLASALELGCAYFLSEDLQDGQLIEAGGKSLTILSPFEHSPDEILT